MQGPTAYRARRLGGADVFSQGVLPRLRFEPWDCPGGPVNSAAVIYFTGGDPSHLLDVLNGSMLFSKVEDALARGAIVAGSSAGAMVMGSWMRFREWREALGLVPGVAVLPHHEGRDPDEPVPEVGELVNGTVLGVFSERHQRMGDGGVASTRVRCANLFGSARGVLGWG